jgi:hypothetical protein
VSVQGVCALTICSEPCLLALPSSSTEGTLRIYNLLGGGNVLCEIAAHKSPVVSPACSKVTGTLMLRRRGSKGGDACMNRQ